MFGILTMAKSRIVAIIVSSVVVVFGLLGLDAANVIDVTQVEAFVETGIVLAVYLGKTLVQMFLEQRTLQSGDAVASRIQQVGRVL